MHQNQDLEYKLEVQRKLNKNLIQCNDSYLEEQQKESVSKLMYSGTIICNCLGAL